ncbi:MAG: hypothetical protein JXB35_04980 [Anaerolineae bacterium]|nr:hypothetical protein [Anaerolineae bacterium]
MILLFSERSICTLDQDMRQLTLTRTRIWRTTVQEIPFNDIQAIVVERSRDSDGGSTYRLVIVLKSGDQAPLSGYFTSGRRGYQKQAQQMTDFINQTYTAQPVQASLDGTIRVSKEGTTDGVPWTLEILSVDDGVPTTRWFAARGGLPGHFLLLMPAVGPNAAMPMQGVLASVARFAYRQYLRLLRLDVEELPGLEHAVTLSNLDERLSAHYTALTSDALAGEAWLTPRRVDAIAGWLAQHPFRQRDASEHLVVVVAPRGVWLIFQADIHEDVYVQEITRLGVSLVR